MNTLPPETDQHDTINALLAEVIDSFEKLEIVVYLYRMRFSSHRASAIGSRLSLSPSVVAESLAALLHRGVVRTYEHDGAGWWFDTKSPWAFAVDVIVALYEIDRAELLALMKRVAFDGMQLPTMGRGSAMHEPN